MNMNQPQLPAPQTEMTPSPARGYPGYPGSGGYGYNCIDDPGGGGLIDYWRILHRQKGTLILIALLGLLAGVLLTLSQTPIYQARTALEIQDLNQDFLNIKQVNPVFEGGSTYADFTDIQTQIALLQSPSLIQRVLGKLKTRASSNTISAAQPAVPAGRSDLQFDTSRIAAWRRTFNLLAPKAADDFDISHAASNLKVRVIGETRVIEALYNSVDPRFAADFANTLAKEFIDSNVEARWKTSERTGEWLSRQLEEMRIKLERSDDTLQSYARRAGLMFTSDKANISEEKLRQLQEELSRAQGERIAKQSRWELSRTSPPETLPAVLPDSSLRSLQDQLTELRRERAELITTYTEKHSKVQRVEAQIAPLEAALVTERAAIIDRLRNDYDAALRREKLLDSEYENQAHLVTDQSEKSIQYNILKREVDTNRQLYDAMLQRVKESSIASAMRASNIRIVDAAEPPKLPYKPRLAVNTVLGLLSGLFGGAVFILIRERTDHSLQQPGETRVWLSLPELGVIPCAKDDLRLLAPLPAKQEPKRSRQTISLIEAPIDASTPYDGPLPSDVNVAWQKKSSPVAESFRAVLTSILFSRENGNHPKVLVLTSASPMEGKTTAVSNLGIAFAAINRKVLIIDADLRKPRVHEIFNLPNDQGLGTLLLDDRLADDAVNAVVQKSSVSGLFVLSSGPAVKSAPNLLYSAKLPELLAKFRSEFDIVIIDTPPMLQMPDARVVGRAADAVILVMRAGRTSRDSALAAHQRFEEDGTRVLGTILNDWDPRQAPVAYKGYYSASPSLSRF